MDRNEAITRIRKALKERSGKPWSVTGGRGTAWGWITIDAPPKRRTWRNVLPAGLEPRTARPSDWTEIDDPTHGYGHTGPEDRAELARLLGLERVGQHVSIPSSTDYYVEYVDRAEGRTPSRIGTPYWD